MFKCPLYSATQQETNKKHKRTTKITIKNASSQNSCSNPQRHQMLAKMCRNEIPVKQLNI